MKEWDYVIETLITADEAGLVIFWLKDKSLEESDNLQLSGSMFKVQLLRGEEIVEDLEAALEQFREIATDLGADVLTRSSIIM